MKIRSLPARVIASATLALWVSFTTSVAAQESSTLNTTSGAPVPATERIQLSSGAEDVLKLSRAKINDDITVAFIQNGDRGYNLTVNEIVYLRKEGVSDRVLAAMLSAQSQPAAARQTAPPTAAPAEAPLASASQYVTPPSSTTFVETAPASTVYLATTPTYYSFYDPWPYWSFWYPYPYFTFGFYWGNCNYGYWNHGYWNHGYCYSGYWNNYWHDGNHHGNPHQGNPHPNGITSPQEGRAVPGGKPGMQASKGSTLGGVNQAGLRSGPGTSARTAQSATPAGLSSGNRSQPVAPRASASQINGPRSGQGANPTRISGSGANSRTAARDSIGKQGGTQLTRNSQPVAPRSSPGAGATRVWTGSAGQGKTSRGAVSQNAPSFAGPSRVSASPTTLWNRSPSQPASRPAVSPAASYQRSNFSPSYSSRGVGSVASIGRPSMSSSYGSMGSPSAFRGGGGFAGASAPRMSSGGGGFRGGGGGGGGFSSGGFSHGGGGGGGGRHR